MEVDYTIERIENGYIATGNDSTKAKNYYSTIQAFIAARITEEIAEIENDHRHGGTTEGNTFDLKFTFNEKSA